MMGVGGGGALLHRFSADEETVHGRPEQGENIKELHCSLKTAKSAWNGEIEVKMDLFGAKGGIAYECTGQKQQWYHPRSGRQQIDGSSKDFHRRRD